MVREYDTFPADNECDRNFGLAVREAMGASDVVTLTSVVAVSRITAVAVAELSRDTVAEEDSESAAAEAEALDDARDAVGIRLTVNTTVVDSVRAIVVDPAVVLALHVRVLVSCEERPRRLLVLSIVVVALPRAPDTVTLPLANSRLNVAVPDTVELGISLSLAARPRESRRLALTLCDKLPRLRVTVAFTVSLTRCIVSVSAKLALIFIRSDPDTVRLLALSRR